MNIAVFLLTHLTFTTTLCQFLPENGMKPDVVFGDENDRFDITSLIDDQNKFYGIDPQEYRRQLMSKVETSRKSKDKLIGALKNIVKSLRRSDTNFAYHDAMVSGESGNIADFENNLEKFRKQGEEYRTKLLENDIFYQHGGQDVPIRRKAPDLEHELLLHYAIPVNMKLHGYLQLPLDD